MYIKLLIYLYLTLHTYSFFLSFLLNVFVGFVSITLFPTWHLSLVLFSSLCFSQFCSSVQFSRSVMSDSLQPHESQHARPPITNSQSLPKLMFIESVMPSSHLILCHPLLLLPPIPPIIRVFFNESTLCMRWPKYWSFSLSISPSNEHPGLKFCS